MRLDALRQWTPEDDFVFVFDQGKAWVDPQKPQNKLCASTDHPLAKRIEHSRKWCEMHHCTFHFEQVVFTEDAQNPEPQSRRFSFIFNNEKAIELHIGRQRPYRQVLFANQFETTLLQPISDAVVLTEADPFDEPGPKIVYCNDVFLQMTGYNRSEVIGKSPRLLQGPETSKNAKQCIRQALKAWQPIVQQMTNYRKNGEMFVVELNINPVKDETGWYTHWLSIQRDLTAELARTESIRHSEQVLQSVGMGSWIFDFSEDRLYWDDRMLEIYEVDSQQSVTGFHFWEKLVHPEDRTHFDRSFIRVLNDEAQLNMDFRIVLPQGNTKWIRAKADLIQDPFNNRRKISGVNWDITAEHQSAKEIEKQRKIAEDNAKLASLGELAAGVGHEINNPLSVITVSMDILELQCQSARLPPENSLEIVTKVRDACGRIEKIVNGLRNVSKIKREAIELKPIDLANDIEQTVLMLKELYAKDGIDVTFIKPETDCLIRSDHANLQQIIVNLLSNAHDAVLTTRRKQIKVEIIALDQICRLAVQDSGTGIPETVCERIFDPFVSTKEVGKGTGLGLSITKGLVEACEGAIGFNTAMGKGTTFTVDFPVTYEAIDNHHQVDEPGASGLQVLVVEDDQPVAECILALLNLMNCHSDLAENGAEALSRLEQNQYDLILTDLKMPILNGWDFLENLNRNGIAKQTHKYVMTGEVISNNEVQNQRLKLIADGILQKPVRQIRLAEVVNKVVQAR